MPFTVRMMNISWLAVAVYSIRTAASKEYQPVVGEVKTPVAAL